MTTLYDMSLSGNCHKVRLLLSLLGLSYQTQPVDLRGGEQRGPDHLQRNRLGQVPVLDDNGRIIRDSQAIVLCPVMSECRACGKSKSITLFHHGETS